MIISNESSNSKFKFIMHEKIAFLELEKMDKSFILLEFLQSKYLI